MTANSMLPKHISIIYIYYINIIMGAHLVEYFKHTSAGNDVSINISALDSFVDGNCVSVFIIPGWKNTVHDREFVALADAYVKIPNFCTNVILVNWHDALLNYEVAASATIIVAIKIRDVISKLHEEQLLKNTTLVGFSLGAHIAGVIGKLLKSNGSSLVQIILALDPAGPGFTDFFTNYANITLKSDDAPLVITYMTNAGCAGSTKSLGNLNYIFNLGRQQPGCSPYDCGCSHQRAIAYAIEVITHNGTETPFISKGTLNAKKLSNGKTIHIHVNTNLKFPYLIDYNSSLFS